MAEAITTVLGDCMTLAGKRLHGLMNKRTLRNAVNDT